jgi:magnesium chelatase family protein
VLATINTATICGLESMIINVEVDVAKQSFPAFTVVGLPDKAIDEAKERVRSAIRNSGAEFPQHRITVNLAPADLPKNGPSFDLPIALGLLIASEQIDADIHDAWFVGELSLDGSLRPVSGILAIASLAKQSGIQTLYVPADNAAEAAILDGLTVIGLQSLRQLVLHLTKLAPLQPQPYTSVDFNHDMHDFGEMVDMKDVLGQEQSKRALEIAAAGGHNMLMHGLPGSGKTLLAKAFASILPPLQAQEALEISTIYSVSGLLGREPLVRARPFRSPHHTTSSIDLIGGGTNPKPGEVSLAHHGVLFLDEFAEFPRSVLEVLRQPIEDGVVTVSRAKASYIFPAAFQLLAAQNPCPCGHFSDPHKQCICTPRQLSAYQKRVSGPILDRIDLFVQVNRVEQKHFQHLNQESSESSASIRQRVIDARRRQQQRFNDSHTNCNARMSSAQIKQFCQLGETETQLMQLATQKLNLSARSYFRVLKVSRTIADLDNKANIATTHLSEALQYRPST